MLWTMPKSRTLTMSTSSAARHSDEVRGLDVAVEQARVVRFRERLARLADDA